MSVPRASGTMRAATAAAEPPDEPPGTRLAVPGVAGRLEGAVLGRRAHGELVHVGLADHDRARRLEPGDRGGGEGGAVALEDARAAGGGQAGDVQDVLDRQRHAGERRRRGAAREGGVEAPGARRAPARARRARKASIPGSTAAMRSRWARATSSQETSRAATRRRISAAVSPARSLIRRSPGARGRARRRRRGRPRGPSRRSRPARGSSSRRADVARGVAHRRHARGVERLERLRLGEDLLELAGEERPSPPR